jgi:exosortase/archaeosortase family protein
MSSQTLSPFTAFLLSPQNRPRIFYSLAFLPLIAIVYFHFEYPAAMALPFYGFILLVLKKSKLFSYHDAESVQKMLGILVIVASTFAQFPLRYLFPFMIYYGAVNYTLHILGLFLFFFDVAALKEALGPVLLVLLPSSGPIFSRWAESYFTPFLPFFTSLIVAIVNAIGIKAVIHNSFSNSVILYTPHGPVPYSVLWACIGFESAFMFAVVLVVLLSEGPGSKKTKILWSAIGLAGTFVLNIFRVVLIFVTEYYYTTYGSAQVHNFAGYILFLTWVTVFLYLYSKRESIANRLKLPWFKSTK